MKKYIEQDYEQPIIVKGMPGSDEFKIVDSFSEFEELLQKREKEYELCRMLAVYAWSWVSKKNKQLKDIKIEDSERM